MYTSLKRAVRKLAVRCGVLDVPLFENLEVEINSQCNLRCSTCPNKEHSRPNSTLPTEVLWRIVAELKSIGYAGSVSPHFYNEPLMDSRLADILEHVRRELPKVTITLFTNFTLMTPELYRRLAKSADAFVVTVDEPAVKRKVDAVSAHLTPEELSKLHTRSLNDTGMSNRAGAVDLAGKTVQPLAQCGIPEHYMVVDAVGDVHLCCNDYFGKALFGNVSERSLLSIWNDPLYVRARAQAKALAHPMCRTCFWSGAAQ